MAPGKSSKSSVKKVSPVIWKYSLSGQHQLTELEVPKGAKALSVATQDGHPQIWFLVNPHAKTTKVSVHEIWTGREVSWKKKASQFIGTYQHNYLVCHVFV